MSTAGSPGTRLSATKTTTVAMNKTPINATVRCTTYVIQVTCTRGLSHSSGSRMQARDSGEVPLPRRMRLMSVMRGRLMQGVDRRTFLRFLGVASGAGLLAACAQPSAPAAAPTPAAAPKPTTAPVAAPTTAPAAAPTTAPVAAAKPTAVPAASGPAPKTGGTLTFGMNQDVLTMDVPNYRSTQDMMVAGLIMDGLITYDKDGKLKPGLAESWKQVDDTTYQFVIRKGVKF